MKNLLQLPRRFFILCGLVFTATLTAIPQVAAQQTGNAATAASPYVTLVSKDGTSIQAELISLDGNNLRIRRSDRQDFVFPLDLLNEESQKLIQNWQLDKAIATSLRIQTRERRTSKEKVDNIATYGEKYRTFIQFTIANTSTVPIDDLRIEYRLYYTAEVMNVQDKDALQDKDVSGRLEVGTLEPNSNKLFESNMVELTEMRYKGDYVPTEGKRTSSKDKFTGFWYRVYRGDNLLTEDASPKRLMTVKEW